VFLWCGCVEVSSCSSVWKACRGNELDSGIEAFEAADATAEQPPPPQRIPIEADFLYAYSTTPGTYVVYLTDEMLLLHFA